ncbi:PR domain zinc finger protein 5-like [Phlebotomus argentipes]|uniref:PR domain zinc finger protein 5-like n=1 Tax=Phlebotomus argentipes TaxID=94469 RepID=UPI002892AE88|nr:PR domain zinc finger protein 5-like [Phlebotomus argentipes]
MENKSDKNSLVDIVVKQEVDEVESIANVQDNCNDEDGSIPLTVNSLLIPSLNQGRLEKLYECEICGATHRNMGLLGAHMAKVHSNKVRYNCPHCPAVFRKRQALKRHVALDHVCGYCGLCLVSKTEKSAHVAETHGEDKYIAQKRHRKSYACHDCGRIYTCRDVFRKHLNRHGKVASKESRKCKLCSQQCRTEATLITHLSTHATLVPLACSVRTCMALFITDEHRQEHVATHEEVSACPFCSRTFLLKSNLLKHMNKIHMTKSIKSELLGSGDLMGKEKPLTISQRQSIRCRKMVAKKVKRVPQVKKNFTCKYCNVQFGEKKSLSKHLQDVHGIHRKEASYPCPDCHKKFMSIEYVRSHMNRFCQNRLFCPICEYFCREKNELFDHLRIHDIKLGPQTLSKSKQNHTITSCSNYSETPGEEMVLLKLEAPEEECQAEMFDSADDEFILS